MYFRRFSTLPIIGVVTLVYFIAGKLGLKLAFLNDNASAVWPPLGGLRSRLCSCSVTAFGRPLLSALSSSILRRRPTSPRRSGSPGETHLKRFAGASLVNRFAGGTRAFDRAQDVFKFALAVMASSVIAATFGVTSLALGGFASWANYGPIWITWWLRRRHPGAS